MQMVYEIVAAWVSEPSKQAVDILLLGSREGLFIGKVKQFIHLFIYSTNIYCIRAVSQAVY